MKYTAVGRSESMALSVYVGRAGTGKTQACFEHVKQVIESNPGELFYTSYRIRRPIR